MPMTIWKFPFAVDDNIVVKMPAGAKVLSVQAQYDKPCLWALVDPKATIETREFRLYGTGHPVESTDDKYIGTFQMLNGDLVFHLFEERTAYDRLHTLLEAL